jgi:hypothetical protein
MIKTALPTRMRGLQLDARGYPIPFIVLRDRDGKPHFTINDAATIAKLIRHDLCGICGQRLLRGRWFVGGPLSAFHAAGAYNDPPMHHECATFALRVCPYLALRRYSGQIEGRTLKDPTPRILIDKTVLPDRPVLFVCAMSIGHQVISGQRFIPNRPWREVEYWQDGHRIETAEAGPLVAAALENFQT